jgi:hypothetical protein
MASLAALLVRIGTLLIVGDLLYLAIWTAKGGANAQLFRTVLAAGVVCLVGALGLSIATRARSGITAPSCPTCGKRVARGRVYCEDHLVETINRYRDEQRHKGE